MGRGPVHTPGGIMTQNTLPAPSQIGPGLSPEDLKTQALEAFDALRPGEAITLHLERSLSAALSFFQKERKGQFEWTPTSEGPKVFTVEVFRREAERGSLRLVNEALSWDHDRLDDLEDRAFKMRERGDFEEAEALYTVFAFGLRRHIRFEEEILFPEFESRLGLSSAMGPSAVMRDEHREILECLTRIEQGIGEAASSLESVRHALHAVLGNHNLKEEHIVYPGTDEAMSPIERDALVARIQAL
ncbi:MAG: hemerythrin domain-containing protein, partial [Vicinamibacteria bacterium]